MSTKRWGLMGLAAAIVLALVPFSLVVAGSEESYDLATIEPQTIPLWGATWAKTDVTVIIKPSKGVSPEAVAEVQQSVTDWNRAIHARFAPDDSPFHLVIIDEGKADITIRPKGGGGRVQGQALCNSEGGFFTGCKINVSGKAFGSISSPGTVLSISIQELVIPPPSHVFARRDPELHGGLRARFRWRPFLSTWD